MADLEGLLKLQAIDTEIAQIEHRAAHLPESEVVRSTAQHLGALTSDLAALNGECARLAAVVETNEAAVVDIRRQVERLNGQLRTVIAPREAEALQHEIRLLLERASTIDDESITAIEQTDDLEAATRRLEADVRAATEALATARESLAEAAAAVAEAEGDARARRDAVASTFDDATLVSYDKRRGDLGGVAVARLVRTSCGGCHLDLSPTEVDGIRRMPAGDRECPNCTRWLVV